MKTVLKCLCQDCHNAWMAKSEVINGKIAISEGCPRCGGTPSSVRPEVVLYPTGKVFVTSEVEIPEKQRNVLEADW